ncbi:GUN4 domain-containing protein [Limnospira platensis]|uniref:GUN4 domain-containing protein n=3 Tax=Limnospira TaxID=2596745 RepID=UPI0016884A97|nr:GUN4 domain-containing protein [Arthrospira platensis FACHB-835]
MMAKCPVCETEYTPNEVETCSVCGYDLTPYPPIIGGIPSGFLEKEKKRIAAAKRVWQLSQSQVESAQLMVSKVQSQLDEMTRKIDGFTQSQSQLESQIEAIASSQLQSQSQLESQIEAIASSQLRSLPRLESQIKAIASSQLQSQSRLESQIKAIASQSRSQLESLVKAIASQLQSQNEAIASQSQSQLESLVKAIASQLQSQNEAIASQLQSQNEAIASQSQSQLESLVKAIASQSQSQNEAIASQLQSQNKAIASQLQSLPRLESQIEAIASQLKSQNEAIASQLQSQNEAIPSQSQSRLESQNEAIPSQSQSRLESLVKAIASRPKPIGEPQVQETPIVSSSSGFDYTQLNRLLKSGQWKAADQETAKMMLAVARQTQRGYLYEDDIKNFPCEDLRIIDGLWVKHSNGHFGFSVQKQIYINCGGKPDGRYPGDTIVYRFADEVGWRVGGSWRQWKDYTFSPRAAKEGHLPALGRLGGWVGSSQNYILGQTYSSLVHRLVTCSK